jgi:hypothetical protein
MRNLPGGTFRAEQSDQFDSKNRGAETSSARDYCACALQAGEGIAVNDSGS